MSKSKPATDVAADPPVLAAKVALHPSLSAAVTTRAYSKAAFGEMDLTTLVDELGTRSMPSTAVT